MIYYSPAGVISNWYLSEISPTVESNTLPTPAPEPARALKMIMRRKVRTQERMREMLRGEWGGGGMSPPILQLHLGL